MTPPLPGILASERNREVPPARPGEFRPLSLGPWSIDPPVVLAPMAGVTNVAFRRLCREFGAGLYVSEMITARGLLEGQAKSRRLAQFAADEPIRSLQLYGTDPRILGEAAGLLVDQGQVDHLDLNFGCPVRKVTACGGGAAIPVKPLLLARLVRAVVSRAGKIPVTIKVRLGIDDEHLSYLSSGRVAEQEGCAAIGLHARTAAQLYDGEARWEAIGELKSSLAAIPVLGNGDIWESFDALRLMRSTGCDGVIVGRGCLGRPWLFRELCALYSGQMPQPPPRLGEVLATLLRHGELLIELFGPAHGVQELRKWCGWYLKGYPGTAYARNALFRACTLDDVRAIGTRLDPQATLPPGALRVRRGKRSGTQKVALPPGYLERDDDRTPGPESELAAAGGPGGG